MSLVHRFARGLAVALAGLLAAPWCAAADETAERARIEREKRAAEQRYEAAERACRDRFAVTDCSDAAKSERRAVLNRLRGEENLLAEAERKRRAAGRVEAIRRKVGEEEQRRAAAAVRAARSAEAAAAAASDPRPARRSAERADDAAPQGTEPLPRGRVTIRKPSAPVPTAAQRAAQEARHRAEFDARQRAAQERVEANRRRNAERASGGQSAAPLPDGAASR